MDPNRSGHKRPAGFAAAKLLSTILFGVVLPIVIIAGGFLGARQLMETAPRAKRGGGSGGEASARLVEVIPLEQADQQVLVEAMGLVQPARRVMIQPRVSGEIIWQSDDLEPGGIFKEGELVVRLDPADYELSVRMREAEFRQMESDLRIEMGQQEVARGEFALLGQEIPEEQASLILREPQLEKAAADVEASQAMLDDAKLDLERTEIAAPFNGMILNESVEVGAIAQTSTQLAEIVGTDRFWVELTVPLDELRWIDIPEPGSTGGSMVRVYDEAAWGRDKYRMGQVVRFTANVDSRSRMARLLIGVDDPLALKPENAGQPKLLLNSYVRAEIEGDVIPDAYALPRKYIRDGNTIWVMNSERRLERVELQPTWRGPDAIVTIQEFPPEAQMIVSTLKTPVDGMLLRTRDDEPESSAGPAEATGDPMNAQRPAK
jgi:RND family efflux transporter MFP subunit